MGKIVVGVDGSDHAKRALQWAIEEAKLRGSSVRAVYAYLSSPIDLYGFPGSVSAEHIESAMREADKGAEELLDDALASVEIPPGVDVEREPVRDVSAPQALIERSEEADLVVVGSRGRGGFAGMLLGSVSQQVAQHAKCPAVILNAEG